MPVSATFNGTVYNLPATGETGWGTTTTNFLVDVGNNALCLTGTQTVSNKVLTLQNGSAATPSLAFTADTASGLYQPLSGEVALAAGGVQRLLVDTSGVINVLGAPGIVNASAGDLSLQSTSGAVRAPTMAVTDKSTAVATTAFVATTPVVYDNIGRNLLHNPLFRVQQRGTGPWTTGVYTADRWSLALSTSTASVTIVSLADADRTAIGDEAAVYGLQNVVGGTSGAGDFVEILQRSEGVSRMSNKTVTVSFWAKANTGTPKLGLSMTQFFGTGGSPSSTVAGIGATSVTLSTTWTRYTASIAVPSVAGKTFGSTANTDYMALNFAQSSGATNNSNLGSPGVQSYTLSLWGMQLEVGSVATPLEKPDPRYDLANCQRFYTIGAILAASTGTTAGTLFAQNAYPVTMRASPSVVGTNNSSVNVTSPNAVANSSYPTGAVCGTGTCTATGVYQLNVTYTASADL